MRTSGVMERLGCVKSARTVRLELVLQCDAEPLRGFVREAEDREWRVFAGWLGLARELDRVRDGKAPRVSASDEKGRRPTRLES